MLRSTAVRRLSLEGRVGDVGGDREQLVGDPSAGDAGGAHDLAGRLVETVEPHQQHLGEVGGESVVVGAGGGADQLLDEERVALGALDDHVDLVVGEHGPVTPPVPAPRIRQATSSRTSAASSGLERHPVHPLEP